MSLPPDLAVEVVRTHDARREGARKVALYVAAGVPMTIVVEPKARAITVHRPGAALERLPEADTWDGGDVLPGLRLAVGHIFR